MPAQFHSDDKKNRDLDVESYLRNISRCNFSMPDYLIDMVRCISYKRDVIFTIEIIVG